MTSQDYKAVLVNALERLGQLRQNKSAIEVEMENLRRFVSATIHMLPDAERNEFTAWAREAIGRNEIRELGLTDAIRSILEQQRKRWFTITQIRNSLNLARFDFSGYTSNPLASISATLKRLAPAEVEATEIDGVAAYRWKNTKTNRLRTVKRRQIAAEALYGGPLLGDIPAETEVGEPESIDKPEE